MTVQVILTTPGTAVRTCKSCYMTVIPCAAGTLCRSVMLLLQSILLWCLPAQLLCCPAGAAAPAFVTQFLSLESGCKSTPAAGWHVAAAQGWVSLAAKV